MISSDKRKAGRGRPSRKTKWKRLSWLPVSVFGLSCVPSVWSVCLLVCNLLQLSLISSCCAFQTCVVQQGLKSEKVNTVSPCFVHLSTCPSVCPFLSVCLPVCVFSFEPLSRRCVVSKPVLSWTIIMQCGNAVC